MPEITDTQTYLVRACAESVLLMEWIETLTMIPKELRERSITTMVNRMRGDDADPQVIDAIEKLRVPAVFDAFQQALQDFSGE
ncbi:MAG: hypothetical protein ABI443_03160 [Chthoniobacterales bacterium]